MLAKNIKSQKQQNTHVYNSKYPYCENAPSQPCEKKTFCFVEHQKNVLSVVTGRSSQQNKNKNKIKQNKTQLHQTLYILLPPNQHHHDIK